MRLDGGRSHIVGRGLPPYFSMIWAGVRYAVTGPKGRRVTSGTQWAAGSVLADKP